MSQEEKQVVIALVKITEPQGDGTEKVFGNGTIFETSEKLASYYIKSGYARKPTEEEMDTFTRLPKGRTNTRQMGSDTNSNADDKDKGTKDTKPAAARPTLGRYRTRQSTSAK